MRTLKEYPQLMGRIINIQNMNEKINLNYDRIKDFKRLEKMTDSQLWDEQNNLIPEYNKTFNI